MDKNDPRLIQDENPDRYVIIDVPDSVRMELSFRPVNPDGLTRYGPTV